MRANWLRVGNVAERARAVILWDSSTGQYEWWTTGSSRCMSLMESRQNLSPESYVYLYFSEDMTSQSVVIAVKTV